MITRSNEITRSSIQITGAAEKHNLQPANVDPAQWHQSLGIARQACARIFRDGGSPADALAAFSIKAGTAPSDWSRVVALIAEQLCAVPLRRAA